MEREISFRTEQGLYYSYFKQLAKAPSLSKGIAQLKSDNITENGNTINVFYRFNIHQELFLATIYRTFGLDVLTGLDPIFFYVYFVFGLQGFFMAAMFVTTWILSGTWVAGIATVAFLICNRYRSFTSFRSTSVDSTLVLDY